MPFMKKSEYADSLNILESEVGLVTKTRTATQDMAKEDGGRKIVAAGALYTNPDTAADVGVFLMDYDMTESEKYPVAIVVQGRVKRDRVAAEVIAKEADLKGQGLYIVPFDAAAADSEEPAEEPAE